MGFEQDLSCVSEVLRDDLQFKIRDDQKELYLRQKSLSQQTQEERLLEWDKFSQHVLSNLQSQGPTESENQNRQKSQKDSVVEALKLLAPIFRDEGLNGDVQILKDMSNNQLKEKLRKLVLDGVPMAYRETYWRLVFNLEYRISNNKPYLQWAEDMEMISEYMIQSEENQQKKEEDLKSADDSGTSLESKKQWLLQIDKDLHRTFPLHPFMQERDQLELKRILYAYSNRNQSVGYCQGMNFIAGFLLIQFNQQDAFWGLSTIVEEILKGYFSTDMKEAQVDQKVFRDLVEETMSDLFYHLSDLGIAEFDYISASWFLGCFVNSLPSLTTLRVWDVLFFEKSPTVLLRMALALMFLHSRDIMKIKDQVSCFNYLQNLAFMQYDDESLMMGYEEFCKLQQSHIDQLRHSHRKQYILQAKIRQERNLQDQLKKLEKQKLLIAAEQDKQKKDKARGFGLKRDLKSRAVESGSKKQERSARTGSGGIGQLQFQMLQNFLSQKDSQNNNGRAQLQRQVSVKQKGAVETQSIVNNVDYIFLGDNNKQEQKLDEPEEEEVELHVQQAVMEDIKSGAQLIHLGLGVHALMIQNPDGKVLVKVLDNGQGQLNIRDYTGEKFVVLPQDSEYQQVTIENHSQVLNGSQYQHHNSGSGRDYKTQQLLENQIRNQGLSQLQNHKPNKAQIQQVQNPLMSQPNPLMFQHDDKKQRNADSSLNEHTMKKLEEEDQNKVQLQHQKPAIKQINQKINSIQENIGLVSSDDSSKGDSIHLTGPSLDESKMFSLGTPLQDVSNKNVSRTTMQPKLLPDSSITEITQQENISKPNAPSVNNINQEHGYVNTNANIIDSPIMDEKKFASVNTIDFMMNNGVQNADQSNNSTISQNNNPNRADIDKSLTQASKILQNGTHSGTDIAQISQSQTGLLIHSNNNHKSKEEEERYKQMVVGQLLYYERKIEQLEETCKIEHQKRSTIEDQNVIYKDMVGRLEGELHHIGQMITEKDAQLKKLIISNKSMSDIVERQSLEIRQKSKVVLDLESKLHDTSSYVEELNQVTNYLLKQQQQQQQSSQSKGFMSPGRSFNSNSNSSQGTNYNGGAESGAQQGANSRPRQYENGQESNRSYPQGAQGRGSADLVQQQIIQQQQQSKKGSFSLFGSFKSK